MSVSVSDDEVQDCDFHYCVSATGSAQSGEKVRSTESTGNPFLDRYDLPSHAFVKRGNFIGFIRGNNSCRCRGYHVPSKKVVDGVSDGLCNIVHILVAFNYLNQRPLSSLLFLQRKNSRRSNTR